MKVNEANWDRIARVVLGIVLILIPILFTQETFGIILGIVGLILLVTGAIGFCPLYTVFNISTKKE
jgi:membrane-bound ClpP family serine protease